jgi:hypothetical protein
MASSNRLVVIAVLAALLLLLLFTFTSMPLAVSSGLRLWIWWKARQQQFTIKIDKIEAPFLRPVVIHGFHLINARETTAFRIDASAAQISVGLDLQAILLHTGGRAIRKLSVDGLTMEFHSNSPEPSLTEGGWRTLQNLLPGRFDLRRLNLRIEMGRTVILLRNVSVSGNEIEAGRFATDQVMIASPWFRQSFSQLRGATKWEENRLTLAGLSLAPGLDLASVTSDLSHLDHRNIGLDFDVEVFGGKLRADISHDWRFAGANWNVVGSANGISLAQTSEAIGSAERVGGLLHACKFTFRGNFLDPTSATGWLWTELTTPVWRKRSADVVMLGVTLYNRQAEIQQLYFKQGNNELTLSGEASFPVSSWNWLSPDFRGDISASIANLGDFAGLFGVNRGDFSGQIVIEGIVNARERKIDGHFTANGSALTLFQKPVDLLKAKLNLKATELEIEELEVTHANDFLRAKGKIDIWHTHDARGTAAVSIRNVSDYAPAAPVSSSLTAQLVFDGRLAAIESLQLQDGPFEIGFGGSIDFADLQNVGITLVPTQALFDLGWLADTDCATAVLFLPAAPPEKFLPQIEKIDLHGDLFAGAWRVALRKDAGLDQEWALCPHSNGRSLKIAVGDKTATGFGETALRSFRNGERRPLSLSLDRP